MEGLCSSQHRGHGLVGHPNDVVLRLLGREAHASRLSVGAQAPCLRVGGAVFLAHETGPNAPRRTKLGDFFEEIVVHIEEEGLALRGTFLINPEGVIKTVEIHSNEIARDVSETLRKLKAAQYTAAHPGEVCPAKWKEGEKTLAPSLDLVGKI